MLTRCPHCTASFRVSDAQLQAAHGKVRCGACMQVFNAAEHLLTDETPAASPKAEEMLAGLDHDDDFAALAGAPDSSHEKLANDRARNSPKQASNPPKAKRADDPTAEDDQYDFSDTFKDLNQHRGTKQVAHAGPEPEPIRPNRESQNSPAPTIQLQENANQESSEDHLASEKPEDRNRRSNGANQRSKSIASSRSGRSARESDNPIFAMRADPASTKPTFRVDRSGEWPGKLFWIALITVVLAFITAQLAWFQFDDLARQSQLRPYYKKACQMLGCTLPSLYDISLIRSQNLVVRSHPLVNKALIIDAIVVNQADFEQPFPDIALTFSDINNNVIAKRAFTPGEYLSGEEKKMQGMPTNTPVHIALEILDPGKEAVNYTMGFEENAAYREAE